MLEKLSNWFAKRKLKKYLSNCDYAVARQVFIDTFSESVIPKPLAGLLDEFIKNPCDQTALEIIKFDAKFLNVFELSRKDSMPARTP